jgi:hypothetical protein
MKALAHLISAVAEQVHYRRSLSKEWHRDPFMYRAFKRGVIKLLDTLEPVGEANPPFNIKGLRERPEKKLWQAMADQFETPEAAGDFAADYVLRELYRLVPERDKWAKLRELDKDPELHGATGPIADRMEEEFYAMSNVRRVLGIKEPKEPKS